MSHEHCICGHPAPESKRRETGYSVERATIMVRLDAIKARRLEIAEELGDLSREESNLRTRLGRLR